MKRFVAACLLLLSIPLALFAAEPEQTGAQRLDFRKVIFDAKSKVFPAVVFIRCVVESYEGGKKTSFEIAGSGVIVSPGGEVLTNWHVVDKAVEVRCLLFNGQALEAKVLGSDKDTDLGLIQLKMPAGSPPLPTATLGDSHKLTEGDFVMAMGAPWGLSRSVSMGIVSCTRRFLPGISEYSLWLQTDASISPGNSGGPLVNTAGEVIGINTRGRAEGGEMGFAIPADTIKQVLPQLRKMGRADWSWSGLQLQPIKDFNKNIYFEGNEGVMVADTDPDSPARRAGIQARDRLLAVDGAPLNAVMEEDLPDVRRILALLPRDKPATLELLRDGKRMAVQIIPKEKGRVEGEEVDCPRWDFTVKTINQFDNPDLFSQREKGVFVFGVKSPGNAGSAGLEPQDIILKIDAAAIESMDELKKIHKTAMANVKDNHRVMLTVLRNGLMRQIVLDFARDYSEE